MKIGERLKFLRKRAGLTQEEVAQIVGVTRRMLIYYESGDPTVKLTLQRVNQICAVYGYKAEFTLSRIKLEPINQNKDDEADVEI